MNEAREASDSLGTVKIPAGALYGPHTARAVANFPISGWRMSREFISAVAMIKSSAATAHKNAGRLEAKKADAIIAACREIIDGKHNDQFPVDVFQTGSGTSTNMNVNEVVASRAAQLLGGKAGDKSLVHPNDDVNMAQSSNDVIPSAMHVAAALMIRDSLLAALGRLQDALEQKADEFDKVIKIARTHLMDAVPIRLGQEFSGYAAQIKSAAERISAAGRELHKLPIGGTAVGTGLNAPEDFGPEVCRVLAERTGIPFAPSENRFAAQAGREEIVSVSGAIKAAAVAMGKIASDIRLLASGPRCGLMELKLPALQPGSSIMPGKVNPVICESVVQVACQVVGCDAAITAGATGGVGSILDLSVAQTVIASNLMVAVELLANAAGMFADKCVAGIEANVKHCGDLVERSLALITALVPKIGYDAATEIAKETHDKGKSIRQVCLEKNVLTGKELNDLLDAGGQT